MLLSLGKGQGSGALCQEPGRCGNGKREGGSQCPVSLAISKAPPPGAGPTHLLILVMMGAEFFSAAVSPFPTPPRLKAQLPSCTYPLKRALAVTRSFSGFLQPIESG